MALQTVCFNEGRKIAMNFFDVGKFVKFSTNSQSQIQILIFSTLPLMNHVLIFDVTVMRYKNVTERDFVWPLKYF